METIKLEQSFSNLQKALNIFVKDLAQEYKDLLRRDGKKATGTLIKSIKPLEIEFVSNRLFGCIDVAEYWKYVEYGRRPGKFPPVDKILSWVKSKPVLPRPGSNGKIPTEKQLAFLISRKIARDGIKPGSQLEEALDIVWSKDRDMINDALEKDLQEYVDLVKL